MGPPIDCDDDNECTWDTCHPVAGCVHDWLDCHDSNPCTDDSCDPATGACVFPPNSDPCDDGDACTTEDTCSNGECLGGAPIKCDDGEVCDPATGECVVDQDPCECVRGRVTLCHIPPGNLDNAHTITVGCAARDKHLAHGDVCGPCEDGGG
jgi:hypothetical protein